MTSLALILISSVGAGLYWLEPNEVNYVDGVLFAFIAVLTAGCCDRVPSTPASKILAVFIVLLGDAMSSYMIANIALCLSASRMRRLNWNSKKIFVRDTKKSQQYLKSPEYKISGCIVNLNK